MTTTTKNTYGTEITSTYVGKRAQQPDTPGERPWEHHLWDVTLTREGQVIGFPFRMGLAHEQTKCGKRKPSTIGRYASRPEQVCNHVRCATAGWQPAPPDLYEVFCSLKADATDGDTFGDWCGNLGYDTDSRKAMDLYLRCQEDEERNRRFFGSDWELLRNDEEYQ